MNEAASDILAGRAVLGRYKDAYRVARTTISAGNIVKVIAILLGLAIAILTLNLANRNIIDDQVLGGCIALAVLVVFLGYIMGVLIAAQGQMMSALLDTAVNTSPHTSATEKAEIMGLNEAAQSDKTDATD